MTSLELIRIEQLIENLQYKCSLEISPDNNKAEMVDPSLYSTSYGILFENEIDALFQYCSSGLLLSSINYERFQKQLSGKGSMKLIFKEIKKRLSLRDRFYANLIYFGFSGLNKQSEEIEEEEDNDDITNILQSQKERLITLFITSSYTLLEKYSKILLSDIWKIKAVRKSTIENGGLSIAMKEKFREVIEYPDSDLSSELIEWKLSNPVIRFKVIFDAIKSQYPSLPSYLNKMAKNIGTGIPFYERLNQLKTIRNELSHDNPLYQLSGSTLEIASSQIDEGLKELNNEFMDMPELSKIVISFFETLKDALETMTDMNELLFSIHAFPSVLETLLRQINWI